MKQNKDFFRFASILILCLLILTSCYEDTSSHIYSNETEVSFFEESSMDNTEMSLDFSIEEVLSSEFSEEILEESSLDASDIGEKSEDIIEVSEDSSEPSSLDDFTEDPSFSEITIDSAKERFSDKFTDGEIIQTDFSYASQFINVTYKEITYEGKLYFVQDIYITDIECLSVGFAGLKFGAKYNDYVLDMTEDYREAGQNIIGAINGDYCGLDGKGAIIRNGILYGTGVAQYTMCVLYKNGVMAIIPKEHFNAQRELERGAWHAWDFGPSFLESDGSPVEIFTERLSIRRSNPRTAIGYFEPGHYCFVVAGGRAEGNSYGVSFTQISRFMSSIGCKVAYNLDGGKSSIMVFGDTISNEKYQGTGRRISDIVFIKDIS